MTNEEKHKQLHEDVIKKFKTLQKADEQLTSHDGFGNDQDMSDYLKAVNELDKAAEIFKKFKEYCKQKFLNPLDKYNNEAGF